jgi:hypothetical protein
LGCKLGPILDWRGSEEVYTILHTTTSQSQLITAICGIT